MHAVGIDSSLTCTGFALVSPLANVDPILATMPTEPMAGDLADLQRRIRYITGRVLRLVPGKVLSVIESPYLPKHGGGAVLERAGLYWFLVDQLLQRGPVVTVAAATRAKYAADAGNADKKHVLAAMRGKHPDLVIPDDNAADALALASMGARFLGFPIDGEPSTAQLEAMSAVRWQPTPKEKK